MTVLLSPQAVNHLREITAWTETQFGPDQASRYGEFLRHELDSLGEGQDFARKVPLDQELRWVTCRYKKSAHGHVLVFQKLETYVYVLGIYHTSQHWRAKHNIKETE